jgi:hypothetical protein
LTTRRDPNFVYQTSWGSAQPATSFVSTGSVTLGQTFRFAVPGWIVGARYFRDVSDPGQHFAFVRTGPGSRWLSTARFYPRVAGVAGPGTWEHGYFRPRVPIVVGTTYELVMWFGAGIYWQTAGALATVPVVTGDITAPADTPALFNGEWTLSATLNPDTRDGGARYGIDVLFYKRP